VTTLVEKKTKEQKSNNKKNQEEKNDALYITAQLDFDH
jgi:hypothetical protein